MNFYEIKNKVKEFWDWIWNSDSVLSWIVALILIFALVKFIFFPSMSLIMGTSLPLAGVESSSMDHQIAREESGLLSLCGNIYTEEKKKFIDFYEYWTICGKWYKDNNISKEDFLKFPLKNGFRKGDIIIVWGRFEPKLGDVIIFKPDNESTAPRPIIHRIVKIENGIIQTKGDHNYEQLRVLNNFYKTDETSIEKWQIIGKAVFKIPMLGWLKIIVNEILESLFS